MYDVTQNVPPFPTREAAWRSQAFWGIYDVFYDTILNTDLKHRHFAILQTLVDREYLLSIGTKLDPMTSERLIKKIRQEFPEEEEDAERSECLSKKAAENDIQFLRGQNRAGRPYMVKDEKDASWHPTPETVQMMTDIAETLGQFSRAQYAVLNKTCPEKEDEMQEREGFYNRAKSFLKVCGWSATVVLILAVTTTAGGIDMMPYWSVFDVALGPKGFADDTLTIYAGLKQT